MTKIHFRSYIHKKMILFPQRIDKDIAEDDPVRPLAASTNTTCVKILLISFFTRLRKRLMVKKYYELSYQ